jgi:hypothetical protein
MATNLPERRRALEQQLLELDSATSLETRYLNENMGDVLAKLAADSAALSHDEQAQIQRALALTERAEPSRATAGSSVTPT